MGQFNRDLFLTLMELQKKRVDKGMHSSNTPKPRPEDDVGSADIIGYEFGLPNVYRVIKIKNGENKCISPK